MTAPRTVLVVDDEPALRITLRPVPEDEGHAVVPAADGWEALAAVGRHRPDAVPLDPHMPMMTGRDVIEACRADPATHDLPLIVMSAGDGRSALARCDGRAFLAKPFDPDRPWGAPHDALGGAFGLMPSR